VGRILVHLGMGVLATAVGTLLAGAAGWVRQAVTDPWAVFGLKLGVACVACGLILQFLAPLARKLRTQRCARCDRPVDRGQIYCRDHMKQALEQARDQIRDHTLRARPGRS